MFETDETKLRWLSGLKAGDEVVVSSRVQGDTICKVKHRTPMGQIVIAWFISDIVFSARGDERGGSAWNKKRLTEPTPEVRAEIKSAAVRQAAYRIVASAKWETMSTESLVAVARIVKP